MVVDFLSQWWYHIDMTEVLADVNAQGGGGTYNINQTAWYDGNNGQVSGSTVSISSGMTFPAQGNAVPAGTQFRIALTSPPPPPWQLSSSSSGIDATNVLPVLDISGVVQPIVEYLVTTPFRLQWEVPPNTGGPRTDIAVIGTLSPR